MPPVLKTKEKSVKEDKTKKQTSKEKIKVIKLLRIRCPICFNNLAKDNVVSTKCGHVFCYNCLKKALILKSKCPLCRRKLLGSQGYHSLDLNQNIDEDFEDCIKDMGT